MQSLEGQTSLVTLLCAPFFFATRRALKRVITEKSASLFRSWSDCLMSIHCPYLNEIVVSATQAFKAEIFRALLTDRIAGFGLKLNLVL